MLATNVNGYQSVGYSPDGRAMALGNGDGSVEIFDLNSRQWVKRWQAHHGPIDCLSFHPQNNNWLATVSGDDGILKLWDILRETLLVSTPTGRGVFADFAFSPTGRFLATRALNAQSVDLWEFPAGAPGAKPTLMLKTNLPFSGPAAFSPDERTLAICNQAEPVQMIVALYNVVEGVLTKLPEVYANLIMAAAFAPDGTTLATGGADERLVLWDVNQRTRLWTQRSDFIAVTSIVFTRDGQSLFTSSYDQTIRSWEVADPTRAKTWPGHSAGINRLAMAPDGRSFASASDDGTARIWPLATPDFASAVPPQEEFTTLFSPDDVPAPEREGLSIFAVAVSPAQELAVANENHRLIACDLGTGIVLTNVAATNIFPGERPGLGGLTFSPDGRELAVGSEDGRVAFLDAASLRPLKAAIKLHDSQVTHLAYALNGTTLVTGGRVWYGDQADRGDERADDRPVQRGGLAAPPTPGGFPRWPTTRRGQPGRAGTGLGPPRAPSRGPQPANSAFSGFGGVFTGWPTARIRGPSRRDLPLGTRGARAAAQAHRACGGSARPGFLSGWPDAGQRRDGSHDPIVASGDRPGSGHSEGT